MNRQELGHIIFNMIVCFMFGILIIACKTLTIDVKKEAHCHLKTTAPHSVKCTVDGKVVYEQSGPMKLDLKGCKKETE